ncbi:hypothetical protein M0P65_03355 [Candidatus Gracilibacteria bacterium]|nr:hypothetical protein [Candidatus Gracilibacteria bacterium]
MFKNINKILIIGILSVSLINIIYAVTIEGHGHGTYNSINTVPKGGGINKGNKVGFAVNSSTKSRVIPGAAYSCGYGFYKRTCYYPATTQYYTEPMYCPTGESLIYADRSKNTGLAVNTRKRDGTLNCMGLDSRSPSIIVNFNGYLNDEWTNKDVKMDVIIKDELGSGDDIVTGLKKSWYSVNGAKVDNAGAGFTLNFSEDGMYTIIIGAEDNSTNIATDGSKSTVGNKGEFQYTVKIDKFGPAINAGNILSASSDWVNSKPDISFAVKDLYKGLEIKEFTCAQKPDNSSRKDPVTPSGIVYGNCDPNIKNCTIDSNFTPNNSSCIWNCNDGFTRGSDNKCYENTKILTCSINPLPTDGYKYDLKNILQVVPSISPAYRSSPTSVASDNGDYLSNFEPTSVNYLPEVSSCNFSCKDGYHNEDGKCIDDSAVICCEKNYPLTKSVTIGVAVDCTLPENAENVACVYNDLCGGYVKDVLKQWKDNTRKYTTEGVDNIGTLSEACGMQNIPNSDGITCNPRYYLVGGGTASQSCEIVPVGQWSGQNNLKYNCTNKPANSYYTSNGDNNNCAWNCDSKFIKSHGSCTGETKYNVACTNKPDNTTWNNVNNIDQKWDGNSWEPSNISVYNTHSSNNECRYECKNGYHTENNGVSCISNERSCDIENGTGIQTWDGNSWDNNCIVDSCDIGYVKDNNSCVFFIH